MSYDDLDDLLQANETLREEIAAKNIEISAITSQLAEARKQLINDGSTHYEGCFAGGSKHYQCALGEIKRLTEQLAEARRERDALRKDCVEVEQILGAALRYPRYCDDKNNFPDATEADGVCVGEHTITSLADEAVGKLQQAEERGARSAFEISWTHGHGKTKAQYIQNCMTEWKKRGGA